jgi:hypothetical protein
LGRAEQPYVEFATHGGEDSGVTPPPAAPFPERWRFVMWTTASSRDDGA